MQKKLDKIYNDDFYDRQISGSYLSAKIYLGHLNKFLTIKSVSDIGCGRGSWLKASKELGALTLIGFDGGWNSQANMIEKAITFKSCDLNHLETDGTEKLDLAISLEVAEHLEPSSALSFVKSLTDLSDVVLFGAAYTGQGGTNHINEQPPSYWASIFIEEFDFVPFDLFRPIFWSDDRIEYWYRQNTFLYVRKNSKAYHEIISKDEKYISDIHFMDCIHPELYDQKLEKLMQDSTISGSLGLLYSNIKSLIKLKLISLKTK
jgi:hypothetical protein